MATADHDVGTGATAVFTTASAFEFDILSINLSGGSRAIIDANHMGVTGDAQKIFGDIPEAGGIDIEAVFDASKSGAMQTAMRAAADTLTIAFPDGSGVVGTGAVTAWDWAVPLEERMTQSFTFTWDGKTGPAYS